MKTYHVYIAASISKRLYIGVTSDIDRRMHEHRTHAILGFTDRYNIGRLVYVETTSQVWDALEREKQLKRWRREKKVSLIASVNPQWKDLSQ